MCKEAVSEHKWTRQDQSLTSPFKIVCQCLLLFPRENSAFFFFFFGVLKEHACVFALGDQGMSPLKGAGENTHSFSHLACLTP